MNRIPLLLLALTLLLTGCPGGGSTHSDKELRAAIVLHNEGKYAEALNAFLLIEDDEFKVYKRWELHNYMGSCYMEQEQFEEALARYNLALEENPEEHSVWVNKGVTLRKMDQLDEAEACYQKALELNPNYAELHSSLGSLYIVRDQPEKAAERFDEALRLDPRLAVAHGNYAIALGMMGEFKRAENALKLAEKHGYANTQVVAEYLERLKQTQQLEEQVQALREETEAMQAE